MPDETHPRITIRKDLRPVWAENGDIVTYVPTWTAKWVNPPFVTMTAFDTQQEALRYVNTHWIGRFHDA